MTDGRFLIATIPGAQPRDDAPRLLPAQTLLLTDLFERADSAAGLGGSWGSSGNSYWGISSNAAYYYNATNQRATVDYAGLTASDLEIRASITLSATRAAVGVFLRGGPGASGGRVRPCLFVGIQKNSGASKVQLYTIGADGTTIVVLAEFDRAFTLGGTYELRAAALGNDIAVSIGSEVVGTHTLNSTAQALLTGSMFGLAINKGSGTTSDDAASRINDFRVYTP